MPNDAPLLLDVTRLIWRRWAGRLPTGIDRVCLAYLERFADSSQAVIQHRRLRRILDRESSSKLFQLLADPPSGFRPKLAMQLVRARLKRDCPGGDRLYLNIGHTGLDDPGYRHWLRAAAVRPVYFVHDLIPITHPEFCRPGEEAKHVSRMRTVATTAAGVIGNSQATIDEFACFANSEGLPTPSSLAAWLGTTKLPAADALTASSGRVRFVVLGTIEARKNHEMLLKVWSDLVKKLGGQAPQLLIIGQRGWECEEVFAILDQNHQFKGAVLELGTCSDEQVAAHLSQARALLFPSLVEGYGLPLAEALSAGTPVLASDLPIFREIGQSVPDFIAPLAAEAWESAILDYSQADSASRRAQLARLANYQTPRWEDHFAAVESWLTRL